MLKYYRNGEPKNWFKATPYNRSTNQNTNARDNFQTVVDWKNEQNEQIFGSRIDNYQEIQKLF
jgi:hypothetical protein